MEVDSKLYATIMEKLEFEPSLGSSNITVSIRGNIVVLGGVVKTFAEKYIAENAIKSIATVKAVADEIKVDTSLGRERSDVDIAESIINALKWNVMVPAGRIKVVVEKGHVTLSGEVEWQYQKHHAWLTTSNIWGVKSVANNIIVKPSITIEEDKVKDQIIKELERHARI